MSIVATLPHRHMHQFEVRVLCGKLVLAHWHQSHSYHGSLGGFYRVVREL